MISVETKLDESKLKRICKHAKLETIRKEQAIFCCVDCGIPIPNNLSLTYIKEKRTCIATNLDNYRSLGIGINIEEMKKCCGNPYKEK